MSRRLTQFASKTGVGTTGIFQSSNGLDGLAHSRSLSLSPARGALVVLLKGHLFKGRPSEASTNPSTMVLFFGLTLNNITSTSTSTTTSTSY